MPLYEYVCDECGLPFEALVISGGKVDEVTCPACQSEKITRKISTFASRLSGGSLFSFTGGASSSCSTGSV